MKITKASFLKQAGTGPSRRHIQGSKTAKRLPSVKYSLLQYSKTENFTKKLHTQKNGPSGALKGGHFRNCQRFYAVEGVLSQNIKKLNGGKFFIFGKNLTVPKKTERGGPFGIFQHPFCRKTAKKLKGGPLRKKNSQKKSLAVPKKNWKGGPFGLAGYGMLHGAILFCRTFVELFWSVRVD